LLILCEFIFGFNMLRSSLLLNNENKSTDE